MSSFESPLRLSESALIELRDQVAGTLHTPLSENWDAARMAWLANVDQHLLAVLDVAGRDDIVAAVG